MSKLNININNKEYIVNLTSEQTTHPALKVGNEFAALCAFENSSIPYRIGNYGFVTDFRIYNTLTGTDDNTIITHDGFYSNGMYSIDLYSYTFSSWDAGVENGNTGRASGGVYYISQYIFPIPLKDGYVSITRTDKGDTNKPIGLFNLADGNVLLCTYSNSSYITKKEIGSCSVGSGVGGLSYNSVLSAHNNIKSGTIRTDNKKNCHVIISNQEPITTNDNKYKMSDLFPNDYTKMEVPLRLLKLSSWQGSTQYMFSYCKKLQHVPFLDISNVYYADYMFSYCEALKTIPYLNTSNLKTMSFMFQNCKSLEKIEWAFDITNITTKSQITSMFSNCDNLSGVIKFINCKKEIIQHLTRDVLGNYGTYTIEHDVPKIDILINQINGYSIEVVYNQTTYTSTVSIPWNSEYKIIIYEINNTSKTLILDEIHVATDRTYISCEDNTSAYYPIKLILEYKTVTKTITYSKDEIKTCNYPVNNPYAGAYASCEPYYFISVKLSKTGRTEKIINTYPSGNDFTRVSVTPGGPYGSYLQKNVTIEHCSQYSTDQYSEMWAIKYDTKPTVDIIATIEVNGYILEEKK